MSGGFLVKAARGAMIRFADTECTCKCIEKAIAYSREGVVLQLGKYTWGKHILTVKTGLLRNMTGALGRKGRFSDWTT
jgi:hypothetical protein